MHPAYLRTRFRSSATARWPQELVIISAHATTGENWTAEANAEADQRLLDSIRSTGRWHDRVVGYAPDGDHAEPSWAVEMTLSDGRELGARFRQDAIFHVQGDALSVVRCGDRAEAAAMGSFRARLDVVPETRQR